MPQTVKDVMTPDPTVLPKTATVKEAAELMRKDNIGDVIVVNGHQQTLRNSHRQGHSNPVGAEGADPDKVTLEEIATKDVTTVSPDATIDLAVTLMRDQGHPPHPGGRGRQARRHRQPGRPGDREGPDVGTGRHQRSTAGPRRPQQRRQRYRRRYGQSPSAAAAGAGLILLSSTCGTGVRSGQPAGSRQAASQRPARSFASTGDKAGSDATAAGGQIRHRRAQGIRNQGKKMGSKGKQELIDAKVEHKAHAAGRRSRAYRQGHG